MRLNTHRCDDVGQAARQVFLRVQDCFVALLLKEGHDLDGKRLVPHASKRPAPAPAMGWETEVLVAPPPPTPRRLKRGSAAYTPAQRRGVATFICRCAHNMRRSRSGMARAAHQARDPPDDVHPKHGVRVRARQRRFVLRHFLCRYGGGQRAVATTHPQ